MTESPQDALRGQSSPGHVGGSSASQDLAEGLVFTATDLEDVVLDADEAASEAPAEEVGGVIAVQSAAMACLVQLGGIVVAGIAVDFFRFGHGGSPIGLVIGGPPWPASQ